MKFAQNPPVKPGANTEAVQPYVHLVEDDDAVRESLQMLLESVGHSVKTFSNAEFFLAQYHVDMRGCLVLDIRMPGINGMELQRKLNELHATLPIIFVTGHGDIPMAVEALQRGAIDFIQKPYREQELLDKINEAMAADEENRSNLSQYKRITHQIATLTPREKDVLRLLVMGKPNKVIASILEISQRTVEIHRAKVMEKLRAKSIAHLVRMFMIAEQEVTVNA